MGNKRQRTGVRAISESTIQIDFTYKNVRCRERIKLKPSPSNLKRAELHRFAILDAIERGTFDYSMTFPDSQNRFRFAQFKGDGYRLGDWLETWLERKKTHIKSSTYEGYSKIVKNTLIPNFGDLMISELQRSDVRDWCVNQTASNKRLSNIQSVLRSSLQDALTDELIEVNPLYDWKYVNKMLPQPPDKVDPFSAEEQLSIINSCQNPQHSNLFKFAFWSGLRTSELVALEWKDIDWKRSVVRIQRAKTQAAKEAEEPKTKRSARRVKLLAPALAALCAQKEHTFEGGMIVFHNPLHNAQWSGDAAIRESAWKPALKDAGVRYRNPYQTRHTYASMMLSAGESPIWLANQMGHVDTTMIFVKYGRWMETKGDESGSKAVDLFYNLTNNQQT